MFLWAKGRENGKKKEMCLCHYFPSVRVVVFFYQGGEGGRVCWNPMVWKKILLQLFNRFPIINACLPFVIVITNTYFAFYLYFFFIHLRFMHFIYSSPFIHLILYIFIHPSLNISFINLSLHTSFIHRSLYISFTHQNLYNIIHYYTQLWDTLTALYTLLTQQ